MILEQLWVVNWRINKMFLSVLLDESYYTMWIIDSFHWKWRYHCFLKGVTRHFFLWNNHTLTRFSGIVSYIILCRIFVWICSGIQMNMVWFFRWRICVCKFLGMGSHYSPHFCICRFFWLLFLVGLFLFFFDVWFFIKHYWSVVFA